MNEELHQIDINIQRIGNLIADANLLATRSVPEFDFLGLVPVSDIPVVGSIVNAGNIGLFGNKKGKCFASWLGLDTEVREFFLEFAVNTILPKNNDLVVLSLTRNELASIIEYGIEDSDRRGLSERFPFVSGLQFTFAPNKGTSTEERRLETLYTIDETGKVIDRIIENGEFQEGSDEPIRIVTTSFLANGGLGYPFPELGEDAVNIRDSLDNLLIVDPLIDFDLLRRSDTNSGLFLIDDTNVPLFDLSKPKNLEVGIEDGTILVETDILLSPEEALIFGREDLSGEDAGDAIINAAIAPVGDNFEIISGTTSIVFDDDLLGSLGFNLSEVENGAISEDNFDVGYRIVSNGGDNLLVNLSEGFEPLEGAIRHIGTVSLEYQSEATFARAGTEQDALAEYLLDVSLGLSPDNIV